MRTARSCVVPLAILAALCGSTGSTSAGTQGDGFHALSEHAMATMMKGMDVPPSGDVDHDFVAMMVPHHQGAIDMAVAELTYGKDERLRRIAQEIIVDQQQEIADMRLALGQPLPPSAPAPTTATSAHPSLREESP